MQGIKPPILIFVQSIERARQLFHELSKGHFSHTHFVGWFTMDSPVFAGTVYDNIPVDVIHSDRTAAQVCAIVCALFTAFEFDWPSVLVSSARTW